MGVELEVVGGGMVGAMVLPSLCMGPAGRRREPLGRVVAVVLIAFSVANWVVGGTWPSRAGRVVTRELVWSAMQAGGFQWTAARRRVTADPQPRGVLEQF